MGSGGFAEVYLGEHIHLLTQAAVKLLHTHLATARDIEQFRGEARTIATLVHPNIVRVLDFGVEAGTPFLVMDYAPHGNLRQKHHAGRQLPLPTIVSYVRALASALQSTHDQHLIHRDLKPENVLLGAKHEVLLSDFGLSLFTHGQGALQVKECFGTLAYMAPEVLMGRTPDQRADIFSIGIVFFEVLSGQHPFRADCVGAPAGQILHGEPTPLP